MRKVNSKKNIIEQMMRESIDHGDSAENRQKRLDEAVKAEVCVIGEPYCEAKPEPAVQKIVNRFISEERLAYEFYIGCVIAAQSNSKFIENLFSEIATDEMNDHCAKLIQWTAANGYTVPFKHSEYVRYAGKESSKIIDRIKSGKDPLFYVELAIKSEEDAITSYQQFIQGKDIPYELNAILIQNYYDEVKHLEDLKSMSMAFQAGALLV